MVYLHVIYFLEQELKKIQSMPPLQGLSPSSNESGKENKLNFEPQPSAQNFDYQNQNWCLPAGIPPPANDQN